MSDAARDAISAREEAKRPRQNAVYGRVATKTSLMPKAPKAPKPKAEIPPPEPEPEPEVTIEPEPEAEAEAEA